MCDQQDATGRVVRLTMGGVEYAGCYRIDGGCIHVTYRLRCRVERLRDRDPAIAADLLLRTMVAGVCD